MTEVSDSTPLELLVPTGLGFGLLGVFRVCGVSVALVRFRLLLRKGVEGLVLLLSAGFTVLPGVLRVAPEFAPVPGEVVLFVSLTPVPPIPLVPTVPLDEPLPPIPVPPLVPVPAPPAPAPLPPPP